MKKPALLAFSWFTALVTTAVFATTPTTISHIPTVNEVIDPLLHSGSLVITVLLLLVGILLVMVVVLYKDGKLRELANHEKDLKNIGVLSDLDKTIQANTNARIRSGG